MPVFPVRSLFAVAALLVGLVGCGAESAPPGTEASSPLEGPFRGASGQRLEFHLDGTFVGPAGRGRFSVDGDTLRLTLSDGAVLTGARESDDVIVLSREGAVGPPLTLYREGSAASQTVAAQTRPTDTPQPAEPPRLAVDVPLSVYRDLETVTPGENAVDLLYTAFAEPPVADEVVLSRLSPTWAAETDAFRREELAVAELARIRALVADLKSSPYFSLRFLDRSQPGRGPDARLPYTALAPFDLTTRSFELTPCPHTMSFDDLRKDWQAFASAVVSFDGPGLDCRVPVSDEAVARRVESARANGEMTVSGRLYFVVSSTDRVAGHVPRVHASVTALELHAHSADGTVLASLKVPE